METVPGTLMNGIVPVVPPVKMADAVKAGEKKAVTLPPLKHKRKLWPLNAPHCPPRLPLHNRPRNPKLRLQLLRRLPPLRLPLPKLSLRRRVRKPRWRVSTV